MRLHGMDDDERVLGEATTGISIAVAVAVGLVVVLVLLVVLVVGLRGRT